MALSPEEFRTRFPRESSHLEFKEGVSTKAIQEAVVAFSNTQGGVLLIGVTDDAVVAGRELTQKVEEALHQTIAQARNPGQYSIHRLLVGDKPVVVLGVAPRVEGFSQTSSGRILLRKGPRNDPLFDHELLQFLSARTLERFELKDSGIPLANADPEQLKALSKAYSWDEDVDVAERLSELGLVTEKRSLTIAGALYLTADPSKRLGKAYIEVLRFPDERADYDKRLLVRGPLHHQVREATQLVLGELGTELVVLGLQRHDLPRLPPVVIREAIANAVAHRSYEANRSAIRVEITPSAVKIVSPGPLPTPVTVENIRDAQAPRNLHVIRVLRRFGLAEDAGRGVDVMQDEMRAELLEPPAFDDTGHSVKVFLPITSAVTAREKAWVLELERRGQILPSDRVVLVHAARGEILTNRRVREITSSDRVEAMRALQRLTKAGFLQRSGRRGGSSYALNGTLSPPAGLRLEPGEIRAAVLEMASDEPITNARVRTRFGVDRAEALKILDQLVHEGSLERRGERRGAHYVAI